MRNKIIFSCLLLCFFFAGLAQKQRALIIGIDDYAKPQGVVDSSSRNFRIVKRLYGAKNDAVSMNTLVTGRFDFKAADVKTLYDQSATRAAILASLDTLLMNSNAGDIAFLFFAGHGTEVRNSLSKEINQLDQAIIPADQWKEGVDDIRDKELSDYFHKFIQKQVKLTAIFDCCNSGSISRGPNTGSAITRFAASKLNYDAHDNRVFTAPETEGDYFMIFSAAQRDEEAGEYPKVPDSNTVSHGAFTDALITALNQQSADATAVTIFSATRAILKARGYSQEPVLGANPQRMQQTLFGIKEGVISNRTVLPVSDTANGHISIDGGIGIGLLKGSELAMMDDNKDTLFKIRVDSVLGINKATALVVRGDKQKIQPGYLFTVTYWAPELKPLLTVYIPKSTLTDEDVKKFVSISNQLSDYKVSQMKWLGLSDNSKRAAPYLSIFWSGNICYGKTDKTAPQTINDISLTAILKQFSKKDSTIYVEVPASKQTADAIYAKLKENPNIRLVDDPAAAQYMLFGKAGSNGQPAYGLRRVNFSIKDSLNPLPLFTDCFELSAPNTSVKKSIPDSLWMLSQQLYRLSRWLNLSIPGKGMENMPYYLSFENKADHKEVSGNHYYVNDEINMVLKPNKNYKSQTTDTRYIYLFTIDQTGAMSLFVPSLTADPNNPGAFTSSDLKVAISKDGKLNQKVDLGDIGVGSTGIDTYFLLLTDSPVPDPGSLFSAKGINTTAKPRGDGSPDPVSELLEMDNPKSISASRGKDPSRSFLFQKISFISTNR